MAFVFLFSICLIIFNNFGHKFNQIKLHTLSPVLFHFSSNAAVIFSEIHFFLSLWKLILHKKID